MSTQVLYILIISLGIMLAGLYIFIICTKIAQAAARKRRVMYSQKIRPDLEDLLENRDDLLESRYADYIKTNRERMNAKAYQKAIEDILLEYLENPGHPHWQTVLSIAYDIGLPPLCLPLICSRSNRSIAVGCRKAGLYQYSEALPHMLAALKIFTGETQSQILLGISRIGDVDAMQQAFDDISHFVMLNERAAFQILSVFSGDKHELYKRMIRCSEDYIAALFLKSIDADTAKALSSDIMEVYNATGKETRIAAVRALGKSEETVFIPLLINDLSDADWEVRAMAAKSLGSMPDPNARAALSKSVNDPEWWVRQNAAFSLFSYPNCEELFLDIINTKDSYARDSVIYVLETAGRLDILAAVREALIEIDENEREFLNEYYSADIAAVK